MINGFKNKETWALALKISNSEFLYKRLRKLIEILKCAPPEVLLEDAIKNEFGVMGSQVDWKDLAEYFQGELK